MRMKIYIRYFYKIFEENWLIRFSRKIQENLNCADFKLSMSHLNESLGLETLSQSIAVHALIKARRELYLMYYIEKTYKNTP